MSNETPVFNDQTCADMKNARAALTVSSSNVRDYLHRE